MADHSGAVYSVRVRGKGRGHGDDFKPLGDINDEGARLIHVLDGYLPELNASSDNLLKHVAVDTHNIAGDDLAIMLRQGQRGVAAEIVDSDGNVKARQAPPDFHRVVCGALFRLPPAETTGWLCAHVNHGRSVKTLLVEELKDRFRDDFKDLTLVVEPCALGKAVRKAVDEGRIDRVKLTKLERPRDWANQSTGKWITTEGAAQLTLDIKGYKGWRLIPGLVKRYLDGDDTVYGEITQFEGLQFDEASVQVELDNGTERTFKLHRPEGGHALSQELEGLRWDDDGNPTMGSLMRALGAVLDDIGA